MTRVSIERTDSQHQGIKALTALQGETLKDYATKRLLPLRTQEQQAM